MEKLKRILPYFPEYILLLSVLFYWISSTLWNPIAIILFVIMLVQTIIRNNFIGFVIGLVLVMLSLYLVFALVSELREFEIFTTNAWRLLVVGALWLTITCAVSVFLVFRSLNGFYQS